MPHDDTAPASQPSYDFLTHESQAQVKIDHLHEPLRRVPLFARMNDTEIDVLARLAVERDVEPETQIMVQGAEGGELIVIMKGRVRVELNGQEIAQLGEGEAVGELSLIDGKPRSASVFAAEPSHLLIIQKHTFDHVLESTPRIKDTLLITLVERLRDLHGTISA